eukprot:5963155-Amphidinium_carterae.1
MSDGGGLRVPPCLGLSLHCGASMGKTTRCTTQALGASSSTSPCKPHACSHQQCALTTQAVGHSAHLFTRETLQSTAPRASSGHHTSLAQIRITCGKLKGQSYEPFSISKAGASMVLPATPAFSQTSSTSERELNLRHSATSRRKSHLQGSFCNTAEQRKGSQHLRPPQGSPVRKGSSQGQAAQLTCVSYLSRSQMSHLSRSASVFVS